MAGAAEVKSRMSTPVPGLYVAGDIRAESFRQVTAAVADGTVAALAATRMLQGLLYQTSTTEPGTFVLVGVTLLSVAAVASLIPARRASRVDPMTVLRSE